MKKDLGLAGKLAQLFIDSKLTLLIIFASILLGLGAIQLLPREEEPQIIVPIIDVFVQMPGANAKEVEERVTKPMEKLLWEIPGVEYIYSTSSPGSCLAIVRFRVGEKEEDAIVRLNQKMFANFDLIPPGATQPLIKPRSIDDVPILALTLWSKRYDHYELRQIAAQLHDQIKEVTDVSEVKLIGGQKRQVKVVLDETKMAAYQIAPATIIPKLKQANQELESGSFSSNNQEFLVETGSFLQTANEVGNIVLGVFNNRPVYLRDVAIIEDGAEEPSNYVFFNSGQAANLSQSLIIGSNEKADNNSYPAVTISVAKRKSTNATLIAEQVIEKVKSLSGKIIPADVNVSVTRNYGETAKEKSNELLFHMFLAILSVSVLIWLTLGFRESGVVAIAIPVTLALTLVVFYLYGYTLNRVTLFALIFSIGILVDDAIVIVENIVRHYRMPENKARSVIDIALEAVAEVGNPTILATFTVIAAILPMAFVRGLMGPYMRPIPVGASAAMLFSLLVAFIVTPWAAKRLLAKEENTNPHNQEDWTTKFYRRIMTPLINLPKWRYSFLVMVVVLLLGAFSLVAFKGVMVKMLPFDNKSEIQIVIDMPEATTLEKTATVSQEIGTYLATIPEITDYQTYVGTASPYNFNGLVRHYFLRQGTNVADIQINLAPKEERSKQSHNLAKELRPKIQEIARRHQANIKVAEIPPGPPVLQTLVAEVYGANYQEQIAVAKEIRAIFEKTEGVVDVDWYVEDDQVKYQFIVDKEKAALNGISTEQINITLRLALQGLGVGLLHQSKDKEDVPIILQLPRSERSSLQDLSEISVQGQDSLVPLSQLIKVEKLTQDKSIYHKNLMPVVYVTGDVAGSEESPVYSIGKLSDEIAKIKTPEGYKIEQYTSQQPFSSEQIAMKWDGEWHITYEVFRDLGLAFAAVLILIYILTVGWFESFRTPLVIMAAIPFSLVGILPAHWFMGAFFTATSMIGFIAGAGIVVRNSIILVDFIELRLKEGMPLSEAVIDAGAVRFRPMLLTAAAVVVGASVILFDPIFQGLALSLMAGEVASLLLSRMTVPILYYMNAKGQHQKPNEKIVDCETPLTRHKPIFE